MKRIFVIIMVMAASVASFSAAAQRDKCGNPDREGWRKEISEFKLKYLAQEMDLRDDQKKRFEEVYTQMQEEKRRCVNAAMEGVKRVKKLKNPTEEDYRAASEAITKAREADAEIDARYDARFREFMSQKQIFKMKEAERRFRDRLIEMKHKGKHEKKGHHKSKSARKSAK